MKARDIIALVSLCIGFGLVTFVINKVAGPVIYSHRTVLVVLYCIFCAGWVYLRSDRVKKEQERR